MWSPVMFMVNTWPVPVMRCACWSERMKPEPSSSRCRAGSVSTSKMSCAGALTVRVTTIWLWFSVISCSSTRPGDTAIRCPSRCARSVRVLDRAARRGESSRCGCPWARPKPRPTGGARREEIRVRALYAVPTYAGRCREAGVHGTTVPVDLLGGVVHTLDAQRGVLQRDGGLGADGAAGGQAHVRDQDVGPGHVRGLVGVEHLRRRSTGRTVSRHRRGRAREAEAKAKRQEQIGTNEWTTSVLHIPGGTDESSEPHRH